MCRSPCCWPRPAAPGPADRGQLLRRQAARDRQLRRLRPLHEVRGPGGPPSPARYVKHQLREAVDLGGPQGASSPPTPGGSSRWSAAPPASARQPHHRPPPGGDRPGLALPPPGRRQHLRRAGRAVTKGDLIGQLGSGPTDPHLHFELRIVLDPSDRRFWTDRNSGRPGPDPPAVPVRGRRPAAAPGRRPGGRDPHRDPGGRAGRVLPRPDRRLPRPVQRPAVRAHDRARARPDRPVHQGPGAGPRSRSSSATRCSSATTGSRRASSSPERPGHVGWGVRELPSSGGGDGGSGFAERRVLGSAPGRGAAGARPAGRGGAAGAAGGGAAGRGDHAHPGNDVELAIGYCVSERLVADPDDIEAVRFCAPEGRPRSSTCSPWTCAPGCRSPTRRWTAWPSPPRRAVSAARRRSRP